MPTISERRPWAMRTAAVTFCVLTLTACSTNTGEDTGSTPAAGPAASSDIPAVNGPAASATPAPSAPSSSSSSPVSSNSVVPPASAAAGTAVKLDDPKEVAIKVMGLFARPGEPERRWFSELRPYLEDQYAESAEYIDPARIPFNKIVSGPVMGGDSDNPQVATADFKTNGGSWYVELHQDVPGGDWLVGGIHELRN